MIRLISFMLLLLACFLPFIWLGICLLILMVTILLCVLIPMVCFTFLQIIIGISIMTENTRNQVVKALYSRFEDLQSVFIRNFNQANYKYCDYLVPVVVQVVQAIEEITGDSPLFLSAELHRRVNGHSSLELEHG